MTRADLGSGAQECEGKIRPVQDVRPPGQTLTINSYGHPISLSGCYKWAATSLAGLRIRDGNPKDVPNRRAQAQKVFDHEQQARNRLFITAQQRPPHAAELACNLPP